MNDEELLRNTLYPKGQVEMGARLPISTQEELEEFKILHMRLKEKLELDMIKGFELLNRRKYNKVKQRYFRKRYHDDPYFKKKHKRYMLTRVNCKICGKSIARNYMSTHHKTKKCLNAKLKKNESSEESDKKKTSEDERRILKKLIQLGIKKVIQEELVKNNN